MVAFNKINQFVEDLANGVHNLGTHTLKVYLSNAAPNAATHAVKVDIAEITNQNGYAAPVAVTVDASTETAGTYTLAVTTDITVTASGAVGPFRYVVLFNENPTSPADPLIGWWDYGSSISLANGETFTIDFTASILTIA